MKRQLGCALLLLLAQWGFERLYLLLPFSLEGIQTIFHNSLNTKLMIKITELCLILLTDCRFGFRILHLRFDPILLSQDSPQPPSARHTQQLSFFYIFKLIQTFIHKF